MKKSMLALLLLAFTAGFLVQFPARVFAGPAEDVQVAMQLLKSKAAALGAPSVAAFDLRSCIAACTSSAGPANTRAGN